MVEMETYGEEQAIYPRETIDHKELWILKDRTVDFTDINKTYELQKK